MTYKQIANKVDVLLISKDKTRKIDIEMNKVKEERSSLYNIKVIERKSDIYYGNMLANYYTDIKDKKYKIDIDAIQINFNCYYCPYDKKKEISVYVPYDVKDKRIKKGRKQYFVYLPRIRDLCYNLKDEERKDFALLLTKSYEEMDWLAKGNKEREAVVKLVKKLGKDDRFMEFTDRADFEKALRDVAIEEAMKKGKREGENKKQAEMIKRMHENEASLEFIAKVTKTSIKKVKKILGLN